MNIGITLKKKAYTPEAFAYKKYLIQQGHNVELDYELDPNNDVNIFFMGVRPFFHKKDNKAKVVHEYQSLSIQPFAKIKDMVKFYINEKPDGRIFLNKNISNVYNFKDNKPFIYRDMGVSDLYFQKASRNAHYDIVYCGSLSNRGGIDSIFLNIAKQGFKLVIIGEASNEFRGRFSLYNNVTFLGRMDAEEIAEVYRNSRFGLNYTPDIYPFNIQTSTKTLEYLASGLILITNKYFWVDQFCQSINYNPIYLDEFGSILSLDVDDIKKCEFNFDEYRWNSILKKNNFELFLIKILKGL